MNLDREGRADVVGLQWLRPELAATLAEARQALEVAPGVQGLEACAKALHGVVAALGFVNFPGAARLACDLERLASLPQPSAASIDALRHLIDRLPGYLDRVATARHDLPLLLQPWLNEVRGTLGEPPLSSDDLTRLMGLPAPHEPARSMPAVTPDRAGLGPLIAALCEELSRNKARLDQYLQGSPHDGSALAAIAPSLRRIADALAVLGFQQPRRTILDQMGTIHSLANGEQPADTSAVMDVGGALLYVESTLSGMVGPEDLVPGAAQIPPTELERIHHLAIEEGLTALERIEQSISECVDGGWAAERLVAIPAQLLELRGALAMVRPEALLTLIGALESYVHEHLLPAVQPPPQGVLETLADALCAIEWMLRRWMVDPREAEEALLASARHALDGLAAKQPPHMADSVAPGTALLEDAPLDTQLLDIFYHEARTYLEILRGFLRKATAPAVVTDALQRALHTLKGSAFMAGVVRMGEMAAPVYRLCKEFHARRRAFGQAELDVLSSALALLEQSLEQVGRHTPECITDTSTLAEQVDTLLSQTPANLEVADPDTEAQHVRRRLLIEGIDHLDDAQAHLTAWRQKPGPYTGLPALLGTLDSLAEQVHGAAVPAMDRLCEALLDLYGAIEEASLAASPAVLNDAERAHQALYDMFDELAAGQDVHARPEAVACLQHWLEHALDPSALGAVGSSSVDPLAGRALPVPTGGKATEEALHAFFLEEAADLLESADEALRVWLQDPQRESALVALERDLRTLAGGARLAGLSALGGYADALGALYGVLHANGGKDEDGRARQAHLRLHQWLAHLADARPDVLPLDVWLSELTAPLPLPNEDTLTSGEEAVRASERELLEVFLDEGADLIESAGAALARWQAEPGNALEVENLLRDLHTLKGGARMAEVGPVGDLAHELETLYERVSAGELQPAPALFKLLHKGHDRLALMLDTVRSGEPAPVDFTLLDAVQGYGSRILPPLREPSRPAIADLTALSERGGTDQIKVAAQTLEDLANLAGEASITRGRVEQQVNDGQAAMLEMETTLTRMRDQLIRLDSDTLQPPAGRQASSGAEDAFDPLALERQTHLRELSRALLEAVSDLSDLKETLAARNHEAQALLAQQARICSGLQEGLMRTRMVPFSRVLPRLQRIVRQVAEELGKDVLFESTDTEVEMDRTVLERMIAPLEHMLRNAIDHGLESAQRRLAAGKPARGLIALRVAHEGGEIVIEMSDDGAGIPLAAVREKAIKRGLLSPDSDLRDHDVLQFILQPGFSTAQKITQISGRGLGMDVVHEEVKQLGGSMSIDSHAGSGARFVIHLPFSVSINRALMVQCGEQLFAVPLNSIEGIVRVATEELEAAYHGAQPRYRYAQLSYDLRYLGDVLGLTPRPSPLEGGIPQPLLLVRAPDHQVALHVDALVGSREIVVKSLGPQFAAVPGLTGATILGDGRVVLILDPLAQIRASHLRPWAAAAPATRYVSPPTKPLLAMVVDDSVTVRKVTSRLLERHGMRVITARDGVEALQVLVDHLPDVLLVDIEMPRMDGFELVSKLRADARLASIPVIMITSRTGEKHRQRAMALGVSEFLGKPYQESQLLHLIRFWSSKHA
ncbi:MULTISPECIES: Hpt domain-containing protein [Pseudomonas]|uniref:histidine kinase n=1 Tax=Pseudomonas quercus TaxID=2722792 RepID=A0ABX0YGJ0_9PSED|nr:MULTISPECIES: Hpt domain-containing protein [Pseudomonas]MBF7143680.1 Hpt domain-containing protein [Pseudomonas sp. LY10J]NJP02442.1 response regulator [Pseudomonas quercus]